MRSGAKRPYSQKTIDQLEAVFERSPDDSKLIEDLRGELAYRSTDRAARFRAKLAQASPSIKTIRRPKPQASQTRSVADRKRAADSPRAGAIPSALPAAASSLPA